MKWQDAQKIMGEGAQDDYKLDLAAHQKLYTQSAPALAELLNYAGIREAAKSYHLYDAEAGAAQANYRKWMRLTIYTALLTSIFSGLAMAWGIIDFLQTGQWVYGSQVLSGLAMISAAVGTAGIFFLRSGQLLEKWMNKRAHAETFRVAYFTGLINHALQKGQDATLTTLEYFRRYQLDVQKAYFFTRARQHEASSNKSTLVGAVGAGIATLSSAAGVFSGGNWNALGVLAVFGAALGAFAIGREQMTQDSRNQERYDRTHVALSDITKSLDRVRPAVEAGKLAPAGEFVAAVNDHISNEHRQWLDQAEAAKAGLAKIEEALKSAQTEEEG